MTDMPLLEILEDGVLGSSHSVSSSGTFVSVTISFAGTLPTSLEFRFNDASPEVGRIIEVQSVKINDRYVNTGNFLSIDSLTNGGPVAAVDINGADFIFTNSAEPAASEFTTGATQTFTTGADYYNQRNGTADEIFDMLAGNDQANTGSGNDKIAGGAGNDTIRSGAGNDLVSGGADEGLRGTKKIPLKSNTDEALKSCPDVHSVFVLKHTGGDINWTDDRDLWWHDNVSTQSDDCPCE